jgi:hypothetical protein
MDYYTDNKGKMNKRHARYCSERRSTDLNYRLSCNLRTRLCKALKTGQKAGSAIDDLGCSVDSLKQKLESLWLSGMSWDNYGKGAGRWNIDHVLPLSLFDLTDIESLKLVCHYTNLRPMWESDNIRKSNKII